MARLQDFQTVTPTDSDNLLVVQATGQGLASFGSTLGAKMDKANPEGTGSLSLNKASGSTLGTNAVALGTDNTASGAHSFAEGNHTIASHKAQHVFGEYNLEDVKAGAGVGDRGNYIEIVGKGTSDSARSNARTLDWSGNEVLAGNLTINGNVDVGDALTVKAGTRTTEGNINVTNMTVRQCGHVVTVNGFVLNVPLVANTSVTVCSVSGITFPPDYIRTIAAYAEHAYDAPEGVVYLIFGTDGSMQVKASVTATKTIYFSFSYIA